VFYLIVFVFMLEILLFKSMFYDLLDYDN